MRRVHIETPETETGPSKAPARRRKKTLSGRSLDALRGSSVGKRLLGARSGSIKGSSREREVIENGMDEIAKFFPDSTPGPASLKDSNVSRFEVAAIQRMIRREQQTCVLNPRSKAMVRWDVLTLLALAFTATVTPFEVAFLDHFHSDVLVGFNVAVDAIFTIDIVINFLLMYERWAPEGPRWVADHCAIAKHYIFTWFALDLVSVIPFERIASALTPPEAGSGSDRDSEQLLKLIRLLRLLRLLKLIRIVRATRIFRRWESRLGVSYATATMVKLMLYIVLMTHWFACFWTMQACSEPPLLPPAHTLAQTPRGHSIKHQPTPRLLGGAGVALRRQGGRDHLDKLQRTRADRQVTVLAQDLAE